AGHAPDWGADAAAPALHAAHLRALPTAGGAARPGWRGAVPARGRSAVRGRGGAAAREARPAGAAEPGQGRDRRSTRGGRAPRPRAHAADAPPGRVRAFQEAAGRPRHRRARRGARARAAAQPDLRRTLLKRQEPRMPGARSLALAAVALGMGSGAMGRALDRMRGMKSDIVYDERMHVLSAAFTGLAGAPSLVTEQLGSSMKGMAFPLPEGPVGVGDSWVAEHELPLGQQALNASRPLKSRTRITLKEIQIAGADTSVVLGIETHFPDDPITLTQRGEGGAPQTGTLR